jgi:serine/threonine protein kinase
MSDHFEIARWKSIEADSGKWYKVVEHLGTGGNAATFLAYCASNPMKGILFAVKVFRRRSKPERRDSFLNEAKILGDCAHPSIMQIYDQGVYYDNPFMIMEYLPRTLAEVMRSGPSILEKVAYSFQLMSALDYLHAQTPAIIHRDIKPANIFIKGGSCVLGDFGLMKLVNDDEKEDKEILKESIGAGMPFYYRTPDLVDYLNNVASITTKSDVFQLGLVLAQLFTGWNPERAARSFTEPVELDPLGNIRSNRLGGGIATLINRMLTTDKNGRPDAASLLDSWERLFRETVEAAHELEDRAFHF